MYTSKDLAYLANLAPRTINCRIKKLGIKPTTKNKRECFYNESQKDEILRYDLKVKTEDRIHIFYLVKEVEYLLLPSKMNL